jgi:hypothetical protein
MIGEIRDQHEVYMLGHNDPRGKLERGSLARAGDVFDEGILDRVVVEEGQTLVAGEGEEPNVATQFESTPCLAILLHSTMILHTGATASDRRESAVRVGIDRCGEVLRPLRARTADSLRSLAVALGDLGNAISEGILIIAYDEDEPSTQMGNYVETEIAKRSNRD